MDKLTVVSSVQKSSMDLLTIWSGGSTSIPVDRATVMQRLAFYRSQPKVPEICLSWANNMIVTASGEEQMSFVKRIPNYEVQSLMFKQIIKLCRENMKAAIVEGESVAKCMVENLMRDGYFTNEEDRRAYVDLLKDLTWVRGWLDRSELE